MAFVAWAAGFFDGEGCVWGYATASPQQRKKKSDSRHVAYRQYRFGITVAQVVPAPLHAMQTRWGGTVKGKVSKNPRHRDQFVWTLQGKPAARFLEDVLPYLRVKRAEAEVALPVMFRTHKHGVRFTPEEASAREEAAVSLRLLKGRAA